MISQQSMNIISASDERYLDGLFVSWGSILRYSPEVDLSFHLLHDGVDPKHLRSLEGKMRQVGGRFTMNTYSLETASFSAFPEFFFDSKMPYARLLIPEIVPVERALYVDTDILFTRSVDEINRCELGDCPLGVVEEWGYQGESDMMLFEQEYPRTKQHRYFNSGLLWMDLKAIRDRGMFRDSLRLLSQHPERCVWHDQTALNVVFAGSCRYLDPDLNFQIKAGREPSVDDLDALERRSRNLHYVTRAKPWIHPDQSLHHRVFRAVEARLLNDGGALKACESASPVVLAALLNYAKGIRLKTLSRIGFGARDFYRRLGGEHFQMANALWNEARSNSRVAAVLRSL